MFKKINYIVYIAFFILFFSSTVCAFNNKTKIYLLGDSRFVGMSKYDLNSSHEYYAKTSKGLSYLKTYYSEIKNNITENDFLIINFGVNDLKNKEKYIDYINKISKENNCPIIFMTINPVNEELEAINGYNIKNSDIKEFNEYLAENLNNNIYIMDTNNYLNNNKFETFDGLHYTEDTYKEILIYINAYLENFKE